AGPASRYGARRSRRCPDPAGRGMRRAVRSSSLARHRARSGALAAAGMVAALVGCMPLYAPLVHENPAVATGSHLDDSSTVVLDGGRPRLMLSLVPGDSMPADGAWLAVQWFGPSNTLLASDSQWVDGGDPQALVFELPADVSVEPGEWRAVVSLDGVLLR